MSEPTPTPDVDALVHEMEQEVQQRAAALADSEGLPLSITSRLAYEAGVSAGWALTLQSLSERNMLTRPHQHPHPQEGPTPGGCTGCPLCDTPA